MSARAECAATGRWAISCNEVGGFWRQPVSVLSRLDEPAFREALPLRAAAQPAYLALAASAFRLSASGVQNATQIHTHMCYSEFNHIFSRFDCAMDADVITIEDLRARIWKVTEAFSTFAYSEMRSRPGVYDIPLRRGLPQVGGVVRLLRKAARGGVVPRTPVASNPTAA